MVKENVVKTQAFQFPPNGKAYPKRCTKSNAVPVCNQVSIPSERESISKGTWNSPSSHSFSLESFNSLRTGKHIQRWEKYQRAYENEQRSFNSLRTGKHIQRCVVKNLKVLGILFQFPPNGKAYPKQIRRRNKGNNNWFQFPPNGKAYPKQTRYLRTLYVLGIKFQFPPNGKAYPKWKDRIPEYPLSGYVSIPSERESISKVRTRAMEIPTRWTLFQFPPNGKAYPKSKNVDCTSCFHKFQFPPNGKAYPKSEDKAGRLYALQLVSIPSERESISKVIQGAFSTR